MKYFILAAVAFLLLGCTTVEQNGNQNQILNNTTTIIQNNSQNTSKLTMVDVAKHNTEVDCWLVIDSNIVSVPFDFASTHPGGDAYVQYCGGNATDAFNSKHGAPAKAKMLNLTIGQLG